MRALGRLGLLAALGLGLSSSLPAQSVADAHRQRVLTVARQIMSGARFCTFVTLGLDGQPQARVVDPLDPDPNLRVYVATNPRSRKVEEMGKDARVTLLYFDPARSAYVTLIGRAVPVEGAEKTRHHKKDWESFFPIEKPEAYALYRIVPSRVEVVSAKDGLSGDPATWRPEIVEIK